VQIAWNLILVLSLASLALFLVLCARGEFRWRDVIVFAAGIAVWIAFGTVPFLGKLERKKKGPPGPGRPTDYMQ
jgi:hypothetical protein